MNTMIEHNVRNHQKRDLIYYVKMDLTTNWSSYEVIDYKST